MIDSSPGSPTTAETADDATATARSITPTFRERLRRGRGWLWIAGGTVLTVVVVIALSGLLASTDARPYDPHSAQPSGTKALVEVLRQEGVDVTIPNGPDALVTADPSTTTLVVDESGRALEPSEVAAIVEAGYARVVFLAPTVPTLEVLPVDLGSAGVFNGVEDASIAAGDRCPAPLRDNAPDIAQTGGYVYDPGDAADAWACYGINGHHAVVGASAGGTEFVALGVPDAFTNGLVLDDANAALALGLLGSQPNLEWYVVGPVAAGATAEVFVPPWLTPAIIVLLAAGVATMVWRGRRFGPLVFEHLPVVVPASETMDGRARLYANSRAQLRALDSIRMGTIGRLAGVLGLPATTNPIEVADAVAAQTMRPRDEVRYVLLGAHPTTDRDLIELSTRIRELERACRGSLFPDHPATAERTQRDTKRT